MREKAAGCPLVSSGRVLDRRLPGYVRDRTSFQQPPASSRTCSKQVARPRRRRARSRSSSTSAARPKGPFENGIAAARLFVKSGTLAIQGGREPKATAEIDRRAAPATARSRCRPSCSSRPAPPGAAEVFAAALKGNKRAELVGEHTIGRAGVQKLVKLPGEPRPLADLRAVPPPGRRADPRPRASRGPAPARRATRRAEQPSHAGARVDPRHGLDPTWPSTRPTCEFGAPPPAKDAILDAALERLKTQKAA